MAKKVTVSLVDDFDPAQTAVETVEFGLDGSNYEIDLSEKNAANLRGEMEKWIAAGRKVGSTRRRAPRGISSGDGLPLAEIREWAKKNGHQVSSRGRVSSEIVRAWRKDQAGETAPANKPAAKASPVNKDSVLAGAVAAANYDSPEFSAKK